MGKNLRKMQATGTDWKGNRPITRDWSSSQKTSCKENPGPDRFTGEFYQVFEKNN